MDTIEIWVVSLCVWNSFSVFLSFFFGGSHRLRQQSLDGLDDGGGKMSLEEVRGLPETSRAPEHILGYSWGTVCCSLTEKVCSDLICASLSAAASAWSTSLPPLFINPLHPSELSWSVTSSKRSSVPIPLPLWLSCSFSVLLQLPGQYCNNSTATANIY